MTSVWKLGILFILMIIFDSETKKARDLSPHNVITNRELLNSEYLSGLPLEAISYSVVNCIIALLPKSLQDPGLCISHFRLTKFPIRTRALYPTLQPY